MAMLRNKKRPTDHHEWSATDLGLRYKKDVQLNAGLSQKKEKTCGA